MKRCIFCKSKGPITKEHVFNKCFRELNEVPLRSLDHISYSHPSKRILNGEDLKNITIEHKSGRKHSLTNLVNGSVCSACNNEFLNNIDKQAKNVVTRILRSKSRKFSMTGEDYNNLIMWVYKTILTLTNTKTINYKKIIPSGEYERFYLTKKVPSNVIISLGRLEKSIYKSEPLWLISQNFIAEFPPTSIYAQQILIENKYLFNQKNTFPPKSFQLMKECTKNSFHIILNLNGTLIRAICLPCPDIFGPRFVKKEFEIYPKIDKNISDIIEYDNVSEFANNFRLVYKGKD